MQTQVGKEAQMSLTRTMSALVAKEGLPGLYRGLVPRLFIYLSQGAIFFTAYEVLRQGLYRVAPETRTTTNNNKKKNKCAA